jgi:hypothetical protein
MAYGLHWEWRGFGKLDATIRRRIERLQPISGGAAVVDRYVWCPGLAVNLKLRQWSGGESLKIKRLRQRDESRDVELWEERPTDEHLLPMTPESVRAVFGDLGWEHVRIDGPADREALEDLLVHAAPGVRVLSVVKRRQTFATVVEQCPVRVELTDITEPEMVTSVGLEDQMGLEADCDDVESARAREGLCAVRDDLDLGLPSLSYLDALAFWARGRKLVTDS